MEDNQVIKNCYFSKKTYLPFGTTDQISTYGKLNLLTIKSIWYSLLEKGKEDWYKPNYTISFFTLSEKKNLTNL